MPPPTLNADPVLLARALENFLAEHPRAALLEDGRVIFEMFAAHYSLSAEHGRCTLHLWSDERNLVRTVVGVEARKSSLRLHTRRFGHTKTQALLLAPDRDVRTPTTRDTVRKQYLHLLERVLTRTFPDHTPDGFRTAMDLEHSFGPAYARGMLLRGQTAWAVLGAGATETPATIDGALTLGILWLDQCRGQGGSVSRRLVRGLKLILPVGTIEATRARLQWLSTSLAQWELYSLDEPGEELVAVEAAGGNLKMHLVHAFNPERALERCAASTGKMRTLLPDAARKRVEVGAKGPAEVGFFLHGLEFARARHTVAKDSFAREEQLTFGAGANETPLNADTQPFFLELLARLLDSRVPGGKVRDALYRLQPERWLEAELRKDLHQVDASLRSEFVYSQVPAFAAADRGMLDLLTVNQAGRLVVIELKADEDLHLPLQGLDYWLRVRELNLERRDAHTNQLQQHGYFPGISIGRAAPLLTFVAPALRIHPANEVVLRYLSPEVEWQMIALGESWRKECKVVFRKHGGAES